MKENQRYCVVCDTYKHKRTFKRAGRICTKCRNSKYRQYRKQYQKEWHRGRGGSLKKYIFNHLSQSQCVECGEKKVLVLEFNHKDPSTKSFDLGKAHMIKNLTLKELSKEIKKCEVLCRNCHIVKTHQQTDSWRWQMYLKQSSLGNN